MKLLHKGLLLISVPLAFEMFFAFGFASLLQRSTDQLSAAVHAKKVIAKAERIHVLLSESSILVGLNFEDPKKAAEVRGHFEDIWKEIALNYRDLKTLLSQRRGRGDAFRGFEIEDLKHQLNQLRNFQKFFWQGKESRSAIPEISPEQISAYFIDWYKKRHKSGDASPLGRLISTANNSVKQGEGLHAEIGNEFRNFLLFGILGDILILAGLGIFFGQSIERRLRNLMVTTQRLSRDEDLLPAIQGDDELAKLDLLLHDTASKIIETQRFKKQLLGVVCHELKAPLSAVQILLSLIENDPDGMPASALSTVKRAKKNCNRLQIMVGELLDLESMNADKIKLRLAPVNVYELMESAADMVRAFAKDMEVEIVIQNCDLQTTLDPDRMSQVVVNLLSNAIKFSPKGSEVTLSARENTESGQVELAVTDRGPGIPEDLQESLFEVFSKGAKPKAETKIKGTGMGLSISKAIVTAHGGSIRIISRIGEGSTFLVSLPKDPASLKTTFEDEGGAQKNDPGAANSNKQRKRFRIRHKGLIMIGVPLVTQLLFVGTLAVLLQQANLQLDKQNLARRVVSASQKIVEEMADAAILLLLCRGSEEKYNLYEAEEPKTEQLINDFMSMCSKNKRRRDASEAIKQSVTAIQSYHKTILIESSKRFLTAKNAGEALISGYLDSWSDLSTDVNALASAEEDSEAKDGRVLQAISGNLDKMLLLGLATNILGAVGLAAFLAKNISKRIGQVQINADRILNKEELLPLVTGSDEIAEVDKAFHDAVAALKQEQQIKKQLLAIASHELRSPLAAIVMSLGIISEGTYGEVSPKTAKRLAQAETGTQRLISLINDILDIEKMEAGKFELSIESLQSRPLVARAIACVQPIAEKKKISIENKVEDKLIKADSERLIQVLINLFSNAIKYSPEGQSVKVASHLNGSGDFIITIEDSGGGIDQEIRDRIFERFVKGTEKDNPHGTGLGLPISRAIIEQHGGTIGCDSVEGKGSTFWFSLPLSAV